LKLNKDFIKDCKYFISFKVKEFVANFIPLLETREPSSIIQIATTLGVKYCFKKQGRIFFRALLESLI
jgi:hypothetical protein